MVSGDEEQLQKFGQVFRRFSEETYIGSSPLYASLSDGIAEDLDVLDIASSARGRPVPKPALRSRSLPASTWRG